MKWIVHRKLMFKFAFFPSISMGRCRTGFLKWNLMLQITPASRGHSRLDQFAGKKNLHVLLEVHKQCSSDTSIFVCLVVALHLAGQF